MKILTGSIAVSASVLAAVLMIGVAGAADAQQSSQPGAGMSGTQSGGANNAGAAAGTSVGTGAGPSPMPGVGTSAGTTGGIRSGPVLNNMRANGTSLETNPDPRVPNLAGRPAPPR